METTFALYHNLILFQLAHRSKEIAHQTLNGLLKCSPHSTQLWLLAAQLQDLTASSATAVDVLQTAKLNGLDSKVHVCQLYCYATKLVMKQVTLVLRLSIIHVFSIVWFIREWMIVMVMC
jgi:hypothetical protein